MGNLAGDLPWSISIAWDAVPLDDEVLVTEANSCSDAGMLQIHRPLPESKIVRESHKYYGIIEWGIATMLSHEVSVCRNDVHYLHVRRLRWQ
jgi:hypothetical protein